MSTKTATRFINTGDKKSAMLTSEDPSIRTIFGKEPEGDTAAHLWARVSWFYRCVSLRENGVRTMPFAIRAGKRTVWEFDGNTSDDKPPPAIPWLPKLPRMMGMIAAANILYGAAYYERRKNTRGETVDFSWLLPSTITPNIDGRTGEVKNFKRTLRNGYVTLPPELLTWYWMPDMGVEAGPAVNTPGRAVLASAGVIGALDNVLQGYFERGMIRATILTYKEQMTPDEASALKEWWKRVFTGVKNAFTTQIVRGDIAPLMVGDGIKDLRDNALLYAERESIAAGLGIPQSKVAANAANFATKESDDVMFIQDAVLPDVSWIYEQVNEQLLEPLGFRIIALPEQLSVMQRDETERAQAFSLYVNGGMSIPAAIALLGIDVPEGVEIEKPAPTPPPPPVMLAAPAQPGREMPADEPQNMRALDIIELLNKAQEVERFKRWLKNHPPADFPDYASDLLTDDEKISIAIRLFKAQPPPEEEEPVNELQQEIEALVLAFLASRLSITEMEAQMRQLVADTIETQFRETAGITADAELTAAQASELDKLMGDNMPHIEEFAAAVAEDGDGGGGIIAAGILSRIALWANTARDARNAGRTMGEDSKRFQWLLGATEQHCAVCLEQHTQIRTAAEWRRLRAQGVYPQSRSLPCSGYRCDCRLQEVRN